MTIIHPTPDRLIEASRPRPEPEDDNRGYIMLAWLAITACIIGTTLIILTLWLAMAGSVQTELLVTPEIAIALMEGR